jgi:hypothetical protein
MQKQNLLVKRHIIIVDGDIKYQGEDWHKAQQLFMRYVQDLQTTQVIHQVDKAYFLPDYPPTITLDRLATVHA